MLMSGGDRNQFHDVLPGSSIGLVYEDAARHYAAVAAEGGSLLDSAMTAVLSVRRCESVQSNRSCAWSAGSSSRDLTLLCAATSSRSTSSSSACRGGVQLARV
jgi:alpha-mannosidase